MANLLFLTQRLPYPPTKGEKIRQWQILNYLRQWYKPFVGCLIDDPVDVPHAETVRELCQDMYAAPLDRRRAKVTCARGLLTGDPLTVSFFQHRGLRRWVRAVMTEIKPELTFVISSNMAPYVLDLPRTGRLVVDLVDVDSEKFRAYGETAGFPMRLIHQREHRRLAALERRIALEADHAIFVSEAEAALFRGKVPERADRIIGISNGVDHRYFDPSLFCAPPFDLALPTFVFTGTMDYKPNIEAVCWFASSILPVIRAIRAGAQFIIVGSNPAEAVRRLELRDGVTVTGAVPDVRPYIRHATACVAPMLVARGIQNKVLEAMAMGKPVIVTPGALEGIDAVPGRDVILAGDAREFARAAVRLTNADGTPAPEGMAIGEAARRLILSHYDWAGRLSAFDALIRPALSDSSAGAPFVAAETS